VPAEREPASPRERRGRHTVSGDIATAPPGPAGSAGPALVGGHLPEEVVEDLVGKLAAATAESRPAAAGPTRQLALVGGGIAVGLVVVLILMWLVGHLL